MKAGTEGAKGKLKNGKLLEPPLKRSVKGEPHANLPPASSSISPSSAQPTRQSDSRPPPAQPTKFIMETPQIKEVEASLSESTSQVKSQAGSAAVSHHVAPSASASTPSSVPSMSSDVVIPIVIGKPSTPTVENPESASSKAILDLSTPPIALQNNQIVLNPTIFSSLTPVHLKELESLGARKAVEILQTYIVRYLKEKRRSEKKEKKKEKKDKKRKEGAANAAKEEEETPIVDAEMQDFEKQADAAQTSETKAKPEPVSVGLPPPSEAISQPAMSPTSGITQAVAPLRISSPPVLEPSEGNAAAAAGKEDILADEKEPAMKRRRLDELMGRTPVMV